MIITRDAEIAVESTFEGEKVKMGFDEDAMEHIMFILSEQYSDTELAPIREYTTNGIDAQVEYGWFRPVEITSPSWDSAMFSIQDFGVGMNAEIIRDTYANYGASTKRKSNDYNGSLGIGSKSAFAYTNQFTVESNRDGVKTIVVVSRDEEGGGDMTIVSETPTDDLNGTKVTIPVANIYSFKQTIIDFAKRLAPGLALVDGEDLSEWGTYTKVLGTVRDADGNIVINGIYHAEKSFHPRDRVYMGGVSYPALQPLSEARTDPAHNIVVDVPLGAVQFSPSRESLKDVKATRKTLEFIGKVYREHLAEQVKTDISNAKSVFEALKIYSKNKGFLSSSDRISVAYDGIVLHNSLGTISPGGTFGSFPSHYSWNAFNKYGDPTHRATASKEYYITMTSALNHQNLFIKGYPNTNGVPGAHKDKIQYWAENFFDAPDYFTEPAGLPTNVRLFGTIPDEFSKHPVLSLVPVVEWADIAAIKMPRKSSNRTTRPSMAGKSQVYNNGDFLLVDTSSVTAKNVYYSIGTKVKSQLTDTSFSRENGGAHGAYLKLVNAFMAFQTDAVFINVYANSEKKFLNTFPNAVEITDKDAFLKPRFDNMLKEFKASVNKTARWSAVANSRLGQTLDAINKSVGISHINDPAVQNLKVSCPDNFGHSLHNFYQSRDHYVKAEAIQNKAEAGVKAEIESVMSCYPMLNVVSLSGSVYHGVSREECQYVVDYINEIYNNKESK